MTTLAAQTKKSNHVHHPYLFTLYDGEALFEGAGD